VGRRTRLNIILNFIPLKSGGGLQVGLDFLSQIPRYGRMHNWTLFATEGTPFADVKDARGITVKLIGRRLAQRLLFEYITCREELEKARADVVYTQFGPHWPAAKVKNVVGCAYSNLFYPEIPFWSGLRFYEKAYRTFLDYMRLKRLMVADAIIFESETLAKRAVEMMRLPKHKVFCVKPSPSSIVGPGVYHEETEHRCRKIPEGFRVLLLANYHKNKNIELLPGVAKILRDEFGERDIVFVITLSPSLRQTRNILKLSEELGIKDRIYNIGPVPPQGCSEVYRACDAVILPSRLESFSNNIAEAWIMKKPLLISDLDWARDLCGDGALYFRYKDVRDIAKKLFHLKYDSNLRNRLINGGRKSLEGYPTSKERFLQYLKIIEKTCDS